MDNKNSRPPYSSLVVANHILQKGFAEGTSMDPMKLLKLVYLCHGWYLGIKNSRLISDSVEAWKYGPVIPVLYEKIKHYGIEYIQSLIDINGDNRIGTSEISLDPHTIEIVNKVWEYYKIYSGMDLSNITHIEGSPWHQVASEKDVNTHPLIPDEIIRIHYSKLWENS